MNGNDCLVTIVSVVRNAGHEFEKTLQSIARIKTPGIEYIVLDGESQDETLELISKYGTYIDYWHSRKDAGVYDAMNESIAHAHGKYILNVNAGDELLCIPTEALIKFLPSPAVAVCGGIRTDNGVKVFPKWGNEIKRNNTIPHQGCFYKTSIFATLKYNIQYKVFADFDLNQRIFKSGYSIQLIKDVVCLHSLNGLSNNKKYVREFFSIISNNYGMAFVILSWLYFKKSAIRKRLGWKKCHS